MHINNNHILYTLTGSLLFLLFGFLVLSFLTPFTVDNSYAHDDDYAPDEIPTDNSNHHTSSSTTVNIAPNLSISATDVSISDTPEASGSWLTGTSNVVVSTNNATGYKLYVSSSNTQVDLINSDSSSAKISNLPAETTESTFKSDSSLMNHYGFTHDNNGSDPESGQITTGTYLPITDINNSRLIKATAEKQNISTTNVTFATKVDRSIPAGEYTNTIIFTAIANPVVTPIQDGMNMQDVTQQMCADTPLYSESGTTYTLTDTRDNNSYTIRKLADGHCWMVQNLRLTYDSLVAAGASTTLTNDNTNLLSSFTFPSQNNSTWCTSSSTDCTSQTNHWYPGNTDYGALYNWRLATANGQATYSICPKNWNLPTGGAEGQWYSLFATYQSNYNWSTSSGYNDDMSLVTDATIGPSLAYGGYAYGGALGGEAGSDGSWWSKTQNYIALVNKDGRTYGGTISSDYFVGRSIRCLLSSE